ncbi:MAG: AraC family transcriptional regulator [Candidatus Humimicrobiaceae bacterium]
MGSNFENASIFLPSIDINREISKEGKHIPDFDPEFPIIIKLQKFKIDYIITPNHHDYLEIGYIYDGKGILTVENKKYAFKKDDIIILSNYELHTLSTTKNQSFSLIVIYFMPELIYKPGGLNIDFNYLKPFFYRGNNFYHIIHPDKNDNEYIFSLIEKIYFRYLKKEINYKLESKIYLTEILLSLVKYYGTLSTKFSKNYSKKVKDINRLKELMTLLQKEYNRDITLTEAANIANMSMHYFCKFFKKVIGKTFTNYLLSIRIDKEKELLLTEKITVTSIAYKVGFENLSYFYRKFREFTGYCPTEYINTVKMNK